MAAMLAIGYSDRMCLMTPFPTTWLGRHPKGWMHTMFSTPLWISSIISPVRNQPSPVSFPMLTMGSAYLTSW